MDTRRAIAPLASVQVLGEEKHMVRSFAFAAILAAGYASSAFAQAGATFVDAKSNIHGFGVSAPAPSGGGGGINAVTIALNPGVGRTLTISAAGSAWWGNTAGSNGPDGGLFSAATNISALGPISGFSAPRSGHLLGLFLAGDPTGNPAPANFSYPDAASMTAASFTPELQQIFFIGDGLTGEGVGDVPIFNVPDSATSLVLGIADGFSFSGQPGWYADNTGGYEVAYNVVPTPGALALAGLGGIMISRRRR